MVGFQPGLRLNLCVRFMSKMLPFIVVWALLQVVIMTPQGHELRAIAVSEVERDEDLGAALAFLALVSYIVALRFGCAFIWQGYWWRSIHSRLGPLPNPNATRLLFGFAVFVAIMVPATLMWALPFHSYYAFFVGFGFLYTLYERRVLKSQTPVGQSGKAFDWLGSTTSTLILGMCLAVTTAVAIVVAIFPVFAQALGTLGVITVAMLFWASLVTFILGILPTQSGLPSLYVLLPLPWVVAAWVSAIWFTDRPPPVEIGQETLAEQRPEAEAHFREWLLQFKGEPSTQPIPVFLVAAEGGGLRAAVWTSGLLAQLDRRTKGQFSRHTFAYSGVSGGAIGLAIHNANLATKVGWDKAVEVSGATTGADFLAPAVARLLVTEPLRQLWPGEHGLVLPRDRAFEAVFEQTDARFRGENVLGKPFLAAYLAKVGAPVVILNATDARTGNRFAFSNVKLNSQIDAFTILGPRHDGLAVSRVMHFSARFPAISPPANMPIDATGNDGAPVEKWVSLLDGGYFENTGTNELVDIAQMIARVRAETPAKKKSNCVVSYSPGQDEESREFNESQENRCDLQLKNDDQHTAFLRETAPVRARLQVHIILIAQLSAVKGKPYADAALSYGDLAGPLWAVLASREARTAQTVATLDGMITAQNDAEKQACIDAFLARTESGTYFSNSSVAARMIGDGAHIAIGECQAAIGRDSFTVASLESEVPLAWNLSARSRELVKRRGAEWSKGWKPDLSNLPGWWADLQERKCQDAPLEADNDGKLQCVKRVAEKKVARKGASRRPVKP